MATRIAMVIDQSGSMYSLHKATADGYREYVQDQKKDTSDETYMTLVTFDTVAQVVYKTTPIELVNEDLDALGYVPGGGTALYDAISYATGELQRSMEPDDNALVVVITDGYENSSREVTRDQVLNLIKSKEKTGNWTFAYLGANQDAWAVGSQMGFARGQTMSYDASYVGAVGTYSVLSANTSRVKRARADGQSAAFASTISLVDDESDTVVNP